MRKKIVSACVAGVGAAAAVAVGTTVAAAAPAAQTEYIQFLSTNPNGNPVVIGKGPIHARGTDLALDAHHDRITFPKGTLRIRHTRVSQGGSFDRTTCYGRQTESGTYTVTGGSGAYAHASGRGIYHLVVQFVGCSQHQAPKVFMLQIRAHGPLSF
jgi:hypothetical protein